MLPLDDAVMHYSAAELMRALPLERTLVPVAGRNWSVMAAVSQDALLDTVHTDEELDYFPYGLLLWASAVGLAEALHAGTVPWRGRRILEIGAGVGLPGLVAAGLGANVTQTDYQPASLRVCQLNAEENGIVAPPSFRADWREFRHTEQYDLIIGADILYERTLHADLEAVLRAVAAPGGQIWVADPLRPQAVDFVRRIGEHGWQVERRVLRTDWVVDPREIALYTLRPPAPAD